MKLKNLQQLSLRSNPLVARFVRDMTFDPPSLKELAGRMIKLKSIPYASPEEMPSTLIDYLNSAHQCVNPKCKGRLYYFFILHARPYRRISGMPKLTDIARTKHGRTLIQVLACPRGPFSTAPAAEGYSSIQLN